MVDLSLSQIPLDAQLAESIAKFKKVPIRLVIIIRSAHKIVNISIPSYIKKKPLYKSRNRKMYIVESNITASFKRMYFTVIKTLILIRI